MQMEGSNMTGLNLETNKVVNQSWQHISELLVKVTNELQRKCSNREANIKDGEIKRGEDAKQ
jgi:hypothetical protein